ncbi:MAG: VWA domain-containing protein [Candidatus Thorarchaeota archaeon]
MNLKAKQGRNQKGLCFVSEQEETIGDGLYQISYDGNSMLADIRVSSSVPRDLIILDHRIFKGISCHEDGDLQLEEVSTKIPICTEIRLLLTSTKDLDNRKIADAISKRVSDLTDDFDGLILTIGQSFQIDRLGIRFTVKSLDPVDSIHSAARISWKSLEKIHLDPVESLTPSNIVCIFEVGAASQISDVRIGGEDHVPRYTAALNAIKQVSESYSDYSSNAQFHGFAYSDEIQHFALFDPATGDPTEVSTIDSPSLFVAFTQWIERLISDHVGRPSDPGAALETGIESAIELGKSNSLQTVILFFSSGVHTSGSNPVRVVKNKTTSDGPRILCFVPGEKSNYDVMMAIAEASQGKAMQVTDIEETNSIIETLMDLLDGGP